MRSESARFCTRRPTFSGVTPSTSFAGSIASNTCCMAAGPSASGSGACTRMPSVAGSRVEPGDQRQDLVERRRRGKVRERRLHPFVARRFELGIDINLRVRLVSHQHDAEPGLASGAARELGGARRQVASDLEGDGGPVEDSRWHGLFRCPLELFQRRRAAEHDQMIARVEHGAARRIELHATMRVLNAHDDDVHLIALNRRPPAARSAIGEPGSTRISSMDSSRLSELVAISTKSTTAGRRAVWAIWTAPIRYGEITRSAPAFLSFEIESSPRPAR